MSQHALRPVMGQRKPRVELPDLRKAIRSLHECFLTFPHECNSSLGSHPAHYDWLNGGKGVGLKTSDTLLAIVCGNAHRILDGKVGQDTLPKELRQYHWIEAFITSQDYLYSEGILVVRMPR